MRLNCTNPGCYKSVHAITLWLGLGVTGIKKDGQWFCSPKCFNSFMADRYIEDKRCGLKKRVRQVKLGMLLVKNNLIDTEQLSMALEERSGSLKRLGEILVEHGYISEKELKSALSMQAGVAPINLDPHSKVKMRELIPQKLIDEFHFVLFDMDEKNRIISIAVYDMDYLNCLEDYFAQIFPGYLVKYYLEDREKILAIISRNYPRPGVIDQPGEVVSTRFDMAVEGPAMEQAVKKLVDFLHGMIAEEIKIDNLDRAVWIKSENRDFKIDIYLTKK